MHARQRSSDMPSSTNPYDQFRDINFWKALNPYLHILDESLVQSVSAFNSEAPSPQTLSERLTAEGYFQFHVAPELWQISLQNMANAIKRMVAADIFPVFAFVYDEFWLMFMKQNRIMSQLLGNDYIMLSLFWVWHVDPLKGEGGFAPHRDRTNEVFPKDRPTSLTVWIPLSNATPENSCIYLIPSHCDPAYNTAHNSTSNIQLQDVRALPAIPGDVLCWTTSVLHWGSQGSALNKNAEPRISVGIEFQRADVAVFKQPPLHPLVLPPLNVRLALICSQLLTYKEGRGSIPAELEAFANGMINDQ